MRGDAACREGVMRGGAAIRGEGAACGADMRGGDADMRGGAAIRGAACGTAARGGGAARTAGAGRACGAAAACPFFCRSCADPESAPSDARSSDTPITNRIRITTPSWSPRVANAGLIKMRIHTFCSTGPLMQVESRHRHHCVMADYRHAAPPRLVIADRRGNRWRVAQTSSVPSVFSPKCPIDTLPR